MNEPSAWLRTAILGRLDELGNGALLNAAFGGIVLMQLQDSAGDEREDRTCDKCRVYTPPGSTFYAAMTQVNVDLLPRRWATLKGSQVLVGYGLCAACKAQEEPRS